MGCRNTVVIPILVLLICCTLFFAIPSFAGNKDGKNRPPKTGAVEPDDQQAAESSPTAINDNLPPSTIIDTAKSLFYPLSTTRFAVFQEAASKSWTWIKIKTMMLFKQPQDFPSPAPSLEYMFPFNSSFLSQFSHLLCLMPTIICTFSFRRQANDPEEASADADADTDAATGKVKEAVLKSLDQGTIVIENSARSAAKLAGDAMDTTAKKLQKTLGKQSEAEL